ncbi:unnamed protein product [Mytilus coruscus]|uniref:Uncharacterized protein n=1 Tax=Mytilus coruscus TaxID=42192 RepID=A0A6J8CRN1_MYTCO|nr:unnamed protein product [Mytilus coruscus]
MSIDPSLIAHLLSEYFKRTSGEVPSTSKTGTCEPEMDENQQFYKDSEYDFDSVGVPERQLNIDDVKNTEFREERKALQTKIRKIRQEVESLITEQIQFSEYKERNDASLMKFMKTRLIKVDPLKYSKPSILMRHLMCLKSIYNNKIPPVTQNDGIKLPKMVEKADEKKRELKAVQSNHNVSQTYSNMPYQNHQFQQTVLQHHPTPYNMIPLYLSVNYDSVPQQPQPHHLFNQYTVSMHPSYNPKHPNASMSGNPTFNFNLMPLQVIPPQSPFLYSTHADDVHHRSTDKRTSLSHQRYGHPLNCEIFIVIYPS